MKRALLLVMVLAGAGTMSTRPLGAQQVAYAANVESELDSATQAMLTREYARARGRGIPIEPLMAKVREGRLKRANGTLIRSAVTALSARLDSARSALGPGASPEELVAGADALQAGAQTSALHAVRVATTRPIAAPLGTLAQLLLSGVDHHRALDMIVALLKKDVAPARILALGTMVESDVRSGLRPDESAAFRLRSIEGSFGGFDVFGGSDTAAPVTTTTGGAGSGAAPGKTPQPTRRP